MTDWNTLPEDVVNAVSVNDFKNKLDEYFDDYFGSGRSGVVAAARLKMCLRSLRKK